MWPFEKKLNLTAWRTFRSYPGNVFTGNATRDLQQVVDWILELRDKHPHAKLQRTDDNGLTWYSVMDDGKTKLEG